MSAEDGTVTLRGTVGSLRQKRAEHDNAIAAAWAAPAVTEVDDRIVVEY